MKTVMGFGNVVHGGYVWEMQDHSLRKMFKKNMKAILTLTFTLLEATKALRLNDDDFWYDFLVNEYQGVTKCLNDDDCGGD